MKTVVITGSTRGLGYELAKKFRIRDFNIVLSGTKEETVDKAVEKLQQIKGSGKVCGSERCHQWLYYSDEGNDQTGLWSYLQCGGYGI